MPRKNHNIANLSLEEIIKTAGSRARIAASSGYPLNEEKLIASASVFAEHAQAYIDAYKRSHTLNFGKKNIEDIIKKRAYTCARAQSNRAMVTNDKTLMEKAKKLFPNHAELYVKYYKEAQINMINRKTAQVLKIDGKAERMLELFSSKSQMMVKKFEKVIRN